MNLVDELRKLADLKREGIINQKEFEECKKKLLAESPSNKDANYSKKSINNILTQPITFTSSILPPGKFFIQETITIHEDAVEYYKSGIIGSKHEHINYNSIASVKVVKHMIYADLMIETRGGSQPIVITDLSTSDAERACELIRSIQQIIG